MSKIHIVAAVGNAPEQPINAAATTDLDSVDSNRVHIVGPIAPAPIVTITSFGPGTLVEKRVRFDTRVILHHNPPNLILLSGADRTPNAGDIGKYYADGSGVWREEEWIQANWTQIWTTANALKVFCPSGFNSAFIQLVGGGSSSSFNGHFGANGGYAEKTVVAVPGQYATLTTGTVSTTSRLTQSQGASPPPPYPDTWAVGDIIASPATNAVGGPSSGGDVNIPGLVGSYNSGTNIAAMPAGPGSSKGVASMCPAQSINSGHANGALYGGGGIAVDGITAIGGQSVAYITWRR